MEWELYVALASLAASILVGVVMAMHPEWRSLGWIIVAVCLFTLFFSTASFIQTKYGRLPAGYVPILFGAFGIILAFIGLVYDWPRVEAKGTNNKASIFFQFSGAHDIPKEIHQENILSWYALYTDSIYVNMTDPQGLTLKGFEVPPRWSIFLLFNKPVSFRQMLVKCSGSPSLHSSIQHSTNRYAIVNVVGDVTNATLDISTLQ